MSKQVYLPGDGYHLHLCSRSRNQLAPEKQGIVAITQYAPLTQDAFWGYHGCGYGSKRLVSLVGKLFIVRFSLHYLENTRFYDPDVTGSTIISCPGLSCIVSPAGLVISWLLTKILT